MRWRDGRLRHQECARDLLGGEAADHAQRQRHARLLRQQRMAGGEDQPQQLIADIVVKRGIEIGHDLLLLLQIPRDHVVLVRQHLAAAQMIQRPALGGRHQPCAGLFGNAGRRPMFERRDQGFLGQVLGQRHVAQHPRQTGDQPRLLVAPDGKDGAMDVGGHHGRRPCPRCARLKRRPSHPPGTPFRRPASRTIELRTFLPIPACAPCGVA